MFTLKDINKIQKPCPKAMADCQSRWNSLAKPIGGMGSFEALIVKIAGMTGQSPQLSKRAMVVFCADNGVVAEGVSQAGQETTTLVTKNILEGRSSVNRMAALVDMPVLAVDIGMADTLPDPAIRVKKTICGTGNIRTGPAMTRETAIAAINAGIETACTLKDEGYTLLAAGEMGIGNTTTSSAVAAALLNLPPAEVTGGGTGLNENWLNKKIQVIQDALSLNAPDKQDPVDVVAQVGGLDIAAMAGFYIGCALNQIPAVLDGFISSVAALVAARLNPDVLHYLLPSHLSREPGMKPVVKALGLTPLIHGDMALGEGTGAVMGVGLLAMALAVYNGTTLEDLGIHLREE